jgi:hypothetical protein
MSKFSFIVLLLCLCVFSLFLPHFTNNRYKGIKNVKDGKSGEYCSRMSSKGVKMILTALLCWTAFRVRFRCSESSSVSSEIQVQ